MTGGSPPVRVFSHPRSGTHFLCAALAKVFFPDIDLSRGPGWCGHWAHRISTPGLDFVRLHWGHPFYNNQKGIYVYRDGRDVCLSSWRTKAFLHPAWKDISLSDFLCKPLDWMGTPGLKSDEGLTIVEHWLRHVESWGMGEKLEHKDGVFYIRYEDLLTNAKETLRQIGDWLGVEPLRNEVPSELVGPCPNEGKAGKWREFFTPDDLDKFFSIVPKNHCALWGT